VKWLLGSVLYSIGLCLLLHDWLTSQLPPDYSHTFRVLDVHMPNKRFCTVVFWPDNPDSPQRLQVVQPMNSALPLTSG
jgi:hypothetical protein